MDNGILNEERTEVLKGILVFIGFLWLAGSIMRNV